MKLWKERISRLKPTEIAIKIGEWYNLPPDVVDRGKIITVQDLAQYYFGLKGEDVNHPMEFIVELVNSWSPEERSRILHDMFGIPHIPHSLA